MSTTKYKRLLIANPIAVSTTVVCVGLALSSVLAADSSRTPHLPKGLAIHDGRLTNTLEELPATLGHHDASRSDAAIAKWDNVELPADREVWRHVAVAVAHLYEDRYELAESELREAKLDDPENAAVYYFTGLLGLSRAELVEEFPDAVRQSPFRMVSSVAGLSKAMHRLRFSKSKSRYQLEAMAALEKAVEHASSTSYELPLTDVSKTPTVSDLLTVLGADNFVGKAHGLLAHLNLEHKHPDRAEHHIDNATSLGIPVPYGYRLTGEQFEAQGRTEDSRRAFAKANEEGDVLASAKAVEEKMAGLLKQLLSRPKN